MWDQLNAGNEESKKPRIIPTHVGSTWSIASTCWLLLNHSHACGINQRSAISCWLSSESFPRMWDQQQMNLSTFSENRIIPTHVGSTQCSHRLHLIFSNHSHACGINLSNADSNTSSSESFPRMWDQLQECSAPCCSGRIIPTHVGSTS